MELNVKVPGVPEYLGVRPARLRRLCSISGIRWNRLFPFGKYSAILKCFHCQLLKVILCLKVRIGNIDISKEVNNARTARTRHVRNGGFESRLWLS